MYCHGRSRHHDDDDEGDSDVDDNNDDAGSDDDDDAGCGKGDSFFSESLFENIPEHRREKRGTKYQLLVPG